MGRIEELAQILLRDGYVDNEADARHAALDVLLAALHRSDPAPSQDLPSADETAPVEDGIAG